MSTDKKLVGVRAALHMALQHVLICCPDETVQKAIESVDDAVAELIDASEERDTANAAWNCLEGYRRQCPGPEYERARDADARYAIALARFGVGS
jgi:hypothetical protein